MKKIWLFTPTNSVYETVEKLGKLGVVEIKEILPPEGKLLLKRVEEVERTKKAKSILQALTADPPSTEKIKYCEKDPKRLIDRILFTGDIRKSAQNKLNELRAQLAWYDHWGKEINPRDIADLKQHGIFVRLYEVDKTRLASLKEKYRLETFKERDGKVQVALLTPDESEQLNAKEIPVPDLTLINVKQNINRKERQLAEVERFLKDHGRNINLIQEYLQYWENQRDILRVSEGMGDIEGKLKYLSGFLPEDQIDRFKNVADKECWGYHLSDPETPEEVPVYLRNPPWISIINPVLKFIDIVPGYKEVDVSIYFLVAFALFFAMLVGDAGYGLIFLLVTWAFRNKIPGQIRWLSYVLSGATIAWGIMSGTYFGSETIAAIPFFNQLVLDKISSFGVDNIDFMMHLSFVIGAIHLTTAHLVRIVQFVNSIKLLSEVGWIAFIWGLFLLVEQLVLGKTMPGWSKWLFYAGAFLVTFFSVESKGLFRSMLVSLSNLPLNLINAFSDIISYVRLFAVGLATVTVAASFNEMILASGITKMGLFEMIGVAVALVLGHGLNIALALMAVVVHGLRLNMLEFAGHLNVQFSGKAYKPFKLFDFQTTAHNP